MAFLCLPLACPEKAVQKQGIQGRWGPQRSWSFTMRLASELVLGPGGVKKRLEPEEGF